MQDSLWVDFDTVLNWYVYLVDCRGAHFPMIARIRHLMTLIISDNTDMRHWARFCLADFEFVIHLFRVSLCVASIWVFIYSCRMLFSCGFCLLLGDIIIETISFWAQSCNVAHWCIHLLLILNILFINFFLFCIFCTIRLKLLITFRTITVLDLFLSWWWLSFNSACTDWFSLAIWPEICRLILQQCHVRWLRLFL